MTMSGLAGSMASSKVGQALAKLTGRVTLVTLTSTLSGMPSASDSPRAVSDHRWASASGTRKAGFTSMPSYGANPEMTILICCMAPSVRGRCVFIAYRHVRRAVGMVQKRLGTFPDASPASWRTHCMRLRQKSKTKKRESWADSGFPYAAATGDRVFTGGASARTPRRTQHACAPWPPPWHVPDRGRARCLPPPAYRRAW